MPVPLPVLLRGQLPGPVPVPAAVQVSSAGLLQLPPAEPPSGLQRVAAPEPVHQQLLELQLLLLPEPELESALLLLLRLLLARVPFAEPLPVPEQELLPGIASDDQVADQQVYLLGP